MQLRSFPHALHSDAVRLTHTGVEPGAVVGDSEGENLRVDKEFGVDFGGLTVFPNVVAGLLTDPVDRVFQGLGNLFGFITA